jgi:N-acetyl sugar amidotransferase
MKVLHNLPEKIIYCKRCVMSNQRPATSPEFKKKTTSDTPTSTFGDDGICDACRFNEMKRSFDWKSRRQQLQDLCDRFRSSDMSYDVLVPGSGGKDSIYVSEILRTEFGMTPLTVTWAPHAYTDVGWHNMQAWQQTGVDNLLFTPNPKLHAKLTELAFKNLVNPFQPFIIGQKILAPKIAAKFNIPLIMYGENQAEVHNSIEENISPIMDPKHFTMFDEKEELYFGGCSMSEIIDNYGFKSSEFTPYKPISLDEYEKSKIQVHYMSYYLNWSPQQNYYYSTEVSKFEPNPEGRSEGTYTKFASLDDKIDGQHYFTMLVKFGQGRAMNDACRDIRDGYITRKEGVELVKRYDEEFPEKYFDFFLNYISIDKEEYWDIINRSRSQHLWEVLDGKWKLRHPCV